jgi:hypothetical protein
MQPTPECADQRGDRALEHALQNSERSRLSELAEVDAKLTQYRALPDAERRSLTSEVDRLCDRRQQLLSELRHLDSLRETAREGA